MTLIEFTPKKFIDVLELNGIKFTHLVQCGIDRNYFIPRYKDGSRKIKELDFSYKKNLRIETIQKIATTLVESGFFKDKAVIVYCFQYDNFEALLPSDLL
jgi:hypothetical protein